MRSMVSEESGNAKIVAVAGLLGLAYLVKFRSSFVHILGHDIPDNVYFSVVASLGIITIFSLFYTVHIWMLGGKPHRQLQQEIEAKIAELEQLLVESNERARDYEEQTAQYLRTVSRHVPERLATAKKIIRAIERRVNEAKGLIASQETVDLFSAYDLLQGRLNVSGSPLDALIESDPIPALEPFEVAPTLRRLFHVVDADLNKAVQVQAQLKRVA